MADIADMALTFEELERERCIEAARHQLPPLQTGYCQNCGVYSDKLRNMTCVDCREEAEVRAGRFAGY